mgnify:CR=1 FL=1
MDPGPRSEGSSRETYSGNPSEALLIVPRPRAPIPLVVRGSRRVPVRFASRTQGSRRRVPRPKRPHGVEMGTRRGPQ